jgi:hypothetical protein
MTAVPPRVGDHVEQGDAAGGVAEIAAMAPVATSPAQDQDVKPSLSELELQPIGAARRAQTA